MADVTIYGFPQSTYVRKARIACEEKGVAYDLEDIEFGAPSHLALHPFGMMPAFRHGDFHLYETAAIVRYVDEAFAGPALQPADVKARARMTQWISAINHYYDRAMIREYVIQRLLVPSRGGTPDEEMIAAAVPKIETQLAVLETTLAGSAYLAGDSYSLADIFLTPILFYLRMTPEGETALKRRESVNRWYDTVAARPSFAATLPPQRQAAE